MESDDTWIVMGVQWDHIRKPAFVKYEALQRSGLFSINNTYHAEIAMFVYAADGTQANLSQSWGKSQVQPHITQLGTGLKQ